MNSEELELSLRTEFENYLNSTLARFRQEITDIRVNLDAEIDKHRAQIDTVLSDMETRFGAGAHFDRAFTESVLEHLRLARDEGAELAATAFGEAEKLRKATDTANHDQLRDAINDISRQLTQTTILQSLVAHTARFAPRGAFFILKNDYFIGWRVFGAPGVDEAKVREIFLPTSNNTILAAAANSVSTRRAEFGQYGEDENFLHPLGFGRPMRMVAVPLTVRGRSVAVLYVDGGNEDSSIGLEAIESLVRVAGLTVELQASYAAPRPQQTAPLPHPEPHHSEPPVTEYAPEPQTEKHDEVAPSVSFEPTSFVEPAADTTAEVTEEPEVTQEAVVTQEAAEFQEYTGDVAVEEVPVQEAEAEPAGVPELVTNSEFNSAGSEVSYFEPVTETSDTGSFQTESFDTASFDTQPVIEAVPEPEPAVAIDGGFAPREATNGNGFTTVVEPPMEVATAEPARPRPSGRRIDLPIEVSEAERGLHNEAFSFARLLVSEIKLYNQQKVDEGRASADLYDRLREAIDRSREMYEKRVRPEVAGRFDYFDYMLVSNLAEGNAAKLGANYPGAAV